MNFSRAIDGTSKRTVKGEGLPAPWKNEWYMLKSKQLLAGKVMDSKPSDDFR